MQLCQRNDSGFDDEKSHQPPPLPVKLSQLRGFSAENDARGSLDNLSISSDNTHCRPSPNTGYSRSVLLSPNLVNKLKRISKRSKMSAPLPYVNLSRYDGFDVDSNHVHIPASSTSAPDGGSSWSDLQRSQSKGYDNVKVDRDSEKENKRISISLPGSRENLRNISGSDLNVSRRTRNHSFSNEPIYANERCVTPPPELPPKGPGLRSKSKINAASRPPAPPRPPDRQNQRQIRQKPQNLKSGTNTVSSSSSQQEDYFLMGNFEKEPTHCKIDYSESQRLNESLSGRSFVNLPPKDQRSVRMDPSDCYMIMTGMNEGVKSGEDGLSSRPRYVRSVSVGSTTGEKPVPPLPLQRPDSVSAGNSPKEPRREKLIREENYMLMTNVSPKRPVLENLQTLSEYVNSSKLNASISESGDEKGLCRNLSFSGADSSFTTNSLGNDLINTGEDIKSSNCDAADAKENKNKGVKIEMPFDNLIDFTLPPEHTNSSKSVQLNVSVERNDSTNSKTPGFFSRLMRRNSKDRKSASQSHENLLTTVSSEPTIKEDVAVFTDSSSSGENSRAQSQQDLIFGHADRSRSSSFPNRSSYIAMNESNSSSSTGISVLSQHSDLAATNSSLNSCETTSTRASSNEGQLNESLTTSENVLSDSDVAKGNYDQHSYFYMGPLQNKCNSVDTSTDNLADDGKTGVSDDVKTKDCEVESEKCEPDVAKVFTVLNVQGGNFDKNLCKTDDEKLIDLWHSTHSLNSDNSDKISDLKSKMTLPLEELSPDEKANAIARHISSLPPFVPPKMKSYPTKLSPVLERSTPKKEKPEPLKLSGDSDTPELVESPVLSPSLMKQQAKATLRITPPSEDEHGKIWIPRTSQPTVGM